MGFFYFLANTTGYLLNFLYNLVNNYGVAILLFSILVKLLLVPLSIKQQKSMFKTAKVQDKMKIIQVKYKNDQEKMNQEIMELYKREKINPFGGCIGAIIQIVILISIFLLVRNPLTYMKKIDSEKINQYKNELVEQTAEKNNPYAEIDVIRNFGEKDEDVKINMNFLGVDLSEIPTKTLNDFRVYIIPVLYIISSIISMRVTSKTQQEMSKQKENEVVEENKEDTVKVEDPMNQANKTMTYMMPFIATTVAMTTPLGLGLYWLTNNILMIIERLALNKYIKEEKEVEGNV